MMSFCKKSVNSFLALTNTKQNETPPLQPPPPLSQSATSYRSRDTVTTPATTATTATTTTGLGLFTASANVEKSANVLKSAAVKLSPPPPNCPPTTTAFIPMAAATATINDLFWTVKRDPGGMGFLGGAGGTVDGLMSCTESLGFESTDEMRADDGIGDVIINTKYDNDNNTKNRLKRTAEAEKAEINNKKFPPPISSLSQDGKPTFFLRPVRKDGRLELTRVNIFRPETLLASRQDGRLRLDIVCDNEDDDEDIQEISDKENEDEAEEAEEEEEEEEEKRIMEWMFSDGSRRCCGHNHNVNVCSPPCVSTT